MRLSRRQIFTQGLDSFLHDIAGVTHRNHRTKTERHHKSEEHTQLGALLELYFNHILFTPLGPCRSLMH